MFDNCSHSCAKKPYYADPMSQWNDHKDHFGKKENHMNTYYISARTSGTADFVVEAENEDNAVKMVEWGDVDPVTQEMEEYTDIEVNDVEYGDVERFATLGVTFITRGEVDEDDTRDALYTLLQQFDGKTASYGKASLELVGFSVDHVDEV